ncbi:CAP domain-containing protein [Streptomyces sp. NPDC059477]|uniref:CAP domain-containing protein n=1 Tax=Streptomyces sp. NPDC059477 TaxID=3346847 RepID=UPI0036CFA2EA
MGRHRRSAAGRAARDRATGVVPQGSATGNHDPQDSYGGGRAARGIAPYLNPEAYAETTARSEAYLFATDDDHRGTSGTDGTGDTVGTAGSGPFAGPDGSTPLAGTGGSIALAGVGEQGAGSRRRARKKGSRPVRTGLLGVSAAVALGTVAVATGVLPGTENYRIGGGSGDRIEAADSPTGTPSAQGGTSGSAESGEPGATSDATQRSTSPTPSPSPTGTSAAPGAPAKKTPEQQSPQPTNPATTPSKTSSKTPSNAAPPPPTTKPATPAPSRTAPKAPAAPPPASPDQPSVPANVSEETAAAAEVVRLVNAERAKVGCSPVAANSALSGLAQDFSEDMAARGFFDHTDPDGASPWDRAAAAGISDLGGENIARGQADAAAVMDAWMNSDGHRANILNCDFTTLGVGVQFGSGGPWWTQDFGY